jgi:hypothetical protein
MTELTTSATQLTGLAERAEAEFMFQYQFAAPAPTRSALGIATTRIGGGVALSMRHDPTGYWSKALGFGLTEPVTDGTVGDVLDFYRSQHSPGATLQIAPSALPRDWDGIRSRHGLTAAARIVKLGCAAGAWEPPERRTSLRVAPVGAEHAESWAACVLTGLGMPAAPLAGLLTATVGHPAFRPFAVWDGEDIVGGGNLYLDREVGSLNAASTLPSHRNRGAQSALIAARARQAIAEGCRWLVAEAGSPAPGASNPSLDNMRRAGLRDLYVRQNWRWTPAGRA